MAVSDAYTQKGEEKVIALMTAASWYGEVGTGVTAAAKANTANITPVGARVAVAKTNPSLDKLQMVFTTPAAVAGAITELGIFDAATAGNLLQRHVFDPINITATDSIEFTVTHEQV